MRCMSASYIPIRLQIAKAAGEIYASLSIRRLEGRALRLLATWIELSQALCVHPLSDQCAQHPYMAWLGCTSPQSQTNLW